MSGRARRSSTVADDEEKVEQLEEPTIDWANSAAKQVLIDDLDSEVLPVDKEQLSAKEAWDQVYQHMVEFHGVPYKQFRDRLNALRKAHKKKKSYADWDAQAVAHDRMLHPRKAHNHLGQPVFSTTTALKSLADDVKAGKHKRMKPRELRETCPEYKIFSLSVFRQRIYQQRRRVKFEFYLEEKRLEKEKERKEHLESRNPLKLPGKHRKKTHRRNNLFFPERTQGPHGLRQIEVISAFSLLEMIIQVMGILAGQ